MKSQLIIFDFADTIAKLSPSKEELLQNYILKECGIKISMEKLHDVYHYVTSLIFYSSVTVVNLNDKKKFYSEFNNNIISLLGLSHLIDSSKLFDYFCENGQHWKPEDKIIKILAELKSKDYLISLVSNFDTRLYSLLDNMCISNYFDSIFISQEVGLEKPNVEFLKLSLKKHNVSPEDTFYIGDSYHLDYLPGLKLGLNTYLLDEKNFYTALSNRVCSLEEFNEIIMQKGQK